MKKVFAILAVLVLAVSLSYATSTITLAPTQGTYTGTILCLPHLAGPNTPIFLGEFLPNQLNVLGTGGDATQTMTWTFWGDPKATYTLTGDWGTGTFASFFPDALNNLYGTWGFNDADNDGLADVTGGNVYNPEDDPADITCDGQAKATVTFTPSGVDTWHYDGHSQTIKFHVTFGVTVTL